MNLTIESICAPSEDVVAREIDGELIIVPIASGIGDMEDELYTMNKTGREIWRRLDGVKSLGLIAADLSSEYGAPPSDIERDILGLVTELVRRKMVVAR